MFLYKFRINMDFFLNIKINDLPLYVRFIENESVIVSSNNHQKCINYIIYYSSIVNSYALLTVQNSELTIHTMKIILITWFTLYRAQYLNIFVLSTKTNFKISYCNY
jgi:hypothetical protein